MSDTLQVFGTTYENVAGFKAVDAADNTLTYVRPSGSLSITANSTYDVTNYASAVVNVAGAATNFVMGTFTTQSTSGAMTITLPYTGTGYPIAAMVFVTGGMYNNTPEGNTDWYNSTQRYAVGQWTMNKAVVTAAPTYTNSGQPNYGVTTCIYKNSTSSSTTYNRSSAQTTNTFSASNASASSNTVVRFKSSTDLSVFVAGTSYGLLGSTDYTYLVVYS